MIKREALLYSSRLSGHTSPCRAKRSYNWFSSEYRSHLALGSLSEAVVRYLHPRLHTTALTALYANIMLQGVLSLARLWANLTLFQQRNHGNL
jgi:hypothetical protein